MPLHHVKNFCTATCRATGERCKNPAAFGMNVCRYHGARKPETIRRDVKHPAYLHGNCTQNTRRAYSEASARIRDLDALARLLGMISGPRMRGRKPGGEPI